MRKNVNLRSMLRRPLRAMLLMVLVGLISFASIARAVEYIVVRQETERLNGYYKAIGSLVADSMENRFMTEELAKVLTESEYIDYQDFRRECSGVMDGVVNTDFSGFTSNHSFDLVYYRMKNSYGLAPTYSRLGSLIMPNISPQTDGVHVSDVVFYGIFDSLYVNSDWVSVLVFEIDGVEAGYSDYLPDGYKATLLYPSRGGILPFTLRGADNTLNDDGTAINAEDVFGGLVEGERYLIKGYLDRGYNSYISPVGVCKDLLITPLTSGGLWYIHAPEGESIDFNAPELADLKSDIDMLRLNQSSVQVVSTKDMRAMPMMQEYLKEYFLTAGRWLNREDDINENQVCVVHAQMAAIRGLKVGDTIKMTLRDMQSGNFGYVTDEMLDVWCDLPTKEVELEIVGLYGNYSRQSSDYTMDTLVVYIPDSVMTAGFGGNQPARVSPYKVPVPEIPERFQIYNPSGWNYDGLESSGITKLMLEADAVMYAPNYSFVLKSNEAKKAFLEESGEKLAALGYSVFFTSNNVDVFKASIEPILWSTSVNAVLFAILLILALALSVFLYLQQRWREFAIARALGVPKRRAVRNIISPLAIIGGLAITAGGCFSWNYALAKSAETLAPVLELGGGGMSQGLSPVWLAGLLAACFALLLAFTWFGAENSAHRPVLELLQGSVRAKAAPKRLAADSSGGGVVVLRTVIAWSLSKDAKPPLFMPQARFLSRRIRRSPLKPLLVVMVAAAFMLSIGWMTDTIEKSEHEIERLYRTLEINAEIAKIDLYQQSYQSAAITQSPVTAVFNTGLVGKAYLIATVPPVTENINSSSRASEIPAALTFYVSDSYYERFNRPYLDCVNIVTFDSPKMFFSDIGAGIENIEYAEGYDKSMFETEWSEENPVVLSRSVLQRFGKQLGDTINFYCRDRSNRRFHVGIIAGVYDGELSIPYEEARETVDERITPVRGASVIMPLSVYHRMENGTLRYLTARFIFDSNRNRELAGIRNDLYNAVANPSFGFTPIRLIIWDEELRLAINPLDKTLSLMLVLRPVTVAVSALISAGIALLLVLASVRETAIMRVLGTAKLKAGAALLIEQGLPCIAGLLFGEFAVSMWLGRSNVPDAGIYLAACLLATAYGAFIVIRRKPIELLQVKE